MKEITQIRSLSLWIFFVPLVTVNLCLFISTNFHLLENTFFSVDQIGRSYSNSLPYFDGGLSISRASRTFPQFLVFKPGIVITSFLLCVYWYKNNLLINKFKNTDKDNNLDIQLLRIDKKLLISTNKSSIPEGKIESNYILEKALQFNKASDVYDIDNDKIITSYSLTKDYPFILGIKLDYKKSLRLE